MGGVTKNSISTFGLFVLILGFDYAACYYSDNACYYCRDTGGHPDCRDYKALRKANRHQDDEDQVTDLDQIMIRNCTGLQSYCMIEEVTILGSALECYKCESTVQGGECDKLYSQDEEKRRELYSRNCTSEPFCVLETFTQHKTAFYEGDLFSVIRDCSDNTTYSFNLTYPFTLNLPPKPDSVSDNRTVCGGDDTGTFGVCVLLCNTSYCNGPMQGVSSAWTVQCDMQCILSFSIVYMILLTGLLS